jgi:hypothetical protein
MLVRPCGAGICARSAGVGAMGTLFDVTIDDLRTYAQRKSMACRCRIAFHITPYTLSNKDLEIRKPPQKQALL